MLPLHFSKKLRGRLVIGTEVLSGSSVKDMERFVPKKLKRRTIFSKLALDFDLPGKFTPVEDFKWGMVFEKSYEILTRGHPVSLHTRVENVQDRSEFSKYVISPTKFKLDKVDKLFDNKKPTNDESLEEDIDDLRHRVETKIRSYDESSDFYFPSELETKV